MQRWRVLILAAALGGLAAPTPTPALQVWFTEHPQFSVALPGDSVFFSCKTNTEEAEKSIRWLHNDTLIPEDNNSEDIRVPRPGQLNVRIRSDPERYKRQLGEYRCVADADLNAVGRPRYYVSSLPATLSIAQLDDFLPERPKSIEAFRDNDVVISCKAPYSNPPAFIQFYKDGEAISTDSQGLASPNYQLLNGETLLVYKVQHDNAANYTCSASNHITNEKKMARTWSALQVKEPSRMEKSRLTFRPEESYSVLLGENLTIPCVASGNPKPEIIWTRMGNNERLASVYGGLTLTKVQKKDAGSYMCAVYNGSRRFLRRTTVHVLVPPAFTRVPAMPDPVNEREGVRLQCEATGTPVPSTQWYFNGLPVKGSSETHAVEDGGLLIKAVHRRAAGVYQCLVRNSVGQNLTSVILRSNSSRSHEPLHDEDYPDWFQTSNLLAHLALSPPSKPNVTQSGRKAALLTWKVQNQNSSRDVMPIQFFKVQFREFRRGSRSEWHTLDEVIPSRSRSFEVMGLKTEIKYRFRIVAVYANDDNMHGPLSKRFKLDRSYNLDRPPRQAPIITEVLPLGPSSLRVGWRMNKVSLNSVEGYFIYIRPSGSGKRFRKITLIGHESHAYVFDNLNAGTSYDLRVEAFNLAGSSPTSRVAKKSTLDLQDPDPAQASVEKAGQNRTEEIGEEDEAEKNEMIAPEDLILFLVMGGILVALVLLLIVICSVISCLQKNKARKRFSNANMAIHAKYTDTSRQISLHHSHHSRSAVAVASAYTQDSSSAGQSHVSPGSTSGPIPTTSSVTLNSEHVVCGVGVDDSELEAETSFSSPHRLSQMIGSAGEQRSLFNYVSHYPGLIQDSTVSSGSEVAEKPAGLGSATGFEEYEDEPSVLSWKRRRKSEEIL